jgi:hypothetical protein
MKILNPFMSIDARGRSKRALVYSIWRGLNYVRAFVVPTNPSTDRQIAVRAVFVAASRAWGALTADNRETWRAYSKSHLLTDVFGASFAASGINWFVGLFCRATDLGETPVSNAPSVSAPGDLSGLEAPAGAAGEIDVSWTDNAEGDKVDIWVTPEIPDGREPRKGDFVHHSYTAGATGALVVTGLIEGGRYAFRGRYIQANGLVGPAIQVIGVAGVTP